MTPNRRQFMSSLAVGSVATVPVLCESLAAQQSRIPDRRGERQDAGDGVWRQVDAELDRIYRDLKSNPRPAAAIGALESTLRFLAGYLQERGTDSLIASGLAELVSLRGGRAEFILSLQDRRLTTAREQLQRRRFPKIAIEDYRELPPVDTSKYEAALGQLLSRGYSASLLAGADVIGAVAVKVGTAGGAHVRHVSASRDNCPEARAFMEFAAAEAAALAGLAAFIPTLWPVAAEASLIAAAAYVVWQACEWWSI
jgi:hypothetical protein